MITSYFRALVVVSFCISFSCFAGGLQSWESVKAYREQLKKSAKHGDANSAYGLAESYRCPVPLAYPNNDINKKIIQTDLKQEFYWDKFAAGLGHRDAQFIVGMSYLKGVFYMHENSTIEFKVQSDFEQAKKYLLLSAEQGNTNALMEIDDLCETNQCLFQDESELIHWYKTIADQGIAEAQVLLAKHYLKNNILFKSDRAQAHFWLSLCTPERLSQLEHEMTDKEIQSAKTFRSDWTRLHGEPKCMPAGSNYMIYGGCGSN